MRTRRSRPCPRPWVWSGAFFIGLVVVGLSAGAATAVAQERPDSVRPEDPRRGRDPARERPQPAQDTIPADTAAEDTVPQPPSPLPALGPAGNSGWVNGVWEWDRDDLLRLPDLSLLHLLERIPGVVPVRADVANQPEGAAVFGAGAGAIRYVVDGFVLDPLTAPSFDPARLSLLALQRVRIERRITGATVRIETLTPDDGRTKSVIEAGTGDYGVNLFRGIFLPPRVFGGALGLGFERLAANGYAPGESSQNVSWLKWTWAGDSAGLQAEYRQSTMTRQGVGAGLVGTRADWAVRARSVFGPVTAEGYAGATAVHDTVGDEATTVIREGSAQGGVRLEASFGDDAPVVAAVALRFRSHPRLPIREVETRLRAAPLPWLAVEAEAMQGWWTAGDPTGRWATRAVVGPLLGVQVFAETSRGGPVLGTGPELALPASTDSGAFRVSRDGFRAGLRYQLGGLALGGAVVRVAADTIFGFGLPLDPAWVRLNGGQAEGFEVTARIPTGFEPLVVEGSFVDMAAPAGWLYLPEQDWRASLVYHHSPLPSGNLELFARVEHVFRGRMSVPALQEPFYETVDAYRASNFELVIRVLSVRAFLRWYNMFHRLDQRDLPEFRRPGQHILWGVKWEFWN